MKRLIIFISLFFFSKAILAQAPSCVVLLDSIKGTYTGACNNGKADGEGKSIGIDTYEGTFRKGLPDGNGKYTWSNGAFYYGGWKKGLKDGKGIMHMPVNGADSAISGYWKRGVYVGQYENPYIIHNSSSDVGRVEVTRIIGGKQASITLTVESLIGGGSIYSSTNQSTMTTMTSLEVTRGNYMSKSSSTMTNKDVTIFQGVTFPFRARFNFGNSMLEIEILQEGDWTIYAPINNK